MGYEVTLDVEDLDVEVETSPAYEVTVEAWETEWDDDA